MDRPRRSLNGTILKLKEKPPLSALRRGFCFGALLLLSACRSDQTKQKNQEENQEETKGARQTHASAESMDKAQGSTPLVPDFASLSRQLTPSVVAVISSFNSDTQDGGLTKKAMRGIGSGTIISSDGLVLTNSHVVSGASKIEIENSENQRLPVELVANDPRFDLALLQIPEGKVKDPLLPARLRRKPAQRGEWVMAIGQPYGLESTVTAGIVGGLGRNYDDLGKPPGLLKEGYWYFIQTDAPINIGNSGGPLVDLRGEVLGISTAVRRDGQGLGFAIPAELASRFVSEVKQKGSFSPPTLGIDVSDLNDSLGRRIEVTGVRTGQTANVAGISKGDLILEIDGHKVHRSSELLYRLLLHSAESKLEISIQRGDRKIDLLLEL